MMLFYLQLAQFWLGYAMLALWWIAGGVQSEMTGYFFVYLCRGYKLHLPPAGA